ncbi:MAG: hypothetical protein AB7F94_01435 [Nitrospira sp.]
MEKVMNGIRQFVEIAFGVSRKGSLSNRLTAGLSGKKMKPQSPHGVTIFRRA